GMACLHTRRHPRHHNPPGPPHHRSPVASRSTAARFSRYFPKLESSTCTAGSGYLTGSPRHRSMPEPPFEDHDPRPSSTRRSLPPPGDRAAGGGWVRQGSKGPFGALASRGRNAIHSSKFIPRGESNERDAEAAAAQGRTDRLDHLQPARKAESREPGDV